MAQRSSVVALAAALFVAIGGCLTPVGEGGGATGGGNGTGGGSSGGGTTGGVTGGGSGGGSSGGTGGVNCPASCPVIHSSCNSTTNGQCVCDPGYAGCGSSCVSLTSDSQNCGACFTVCNPSGYMCVNSTCVCGLDVRPLSPPGRRHRLLRSDLRPAQLRRVRPRLRLDPVHQRFLHLRLTPGSVHRCRWERLLRRPRPRYRQLWKVRWNLRASGAIACRASEGLAMRQQLRRPGDLRLHFRILPVSGP